jgi:hypothetical protein
LVTDAVTDPRPSAVSLRVGGSRIATLPLRRAAATAVSPLPIARFDDPLQCTDIGYRSGTTRVPVATPSGWTMLPLSSTVWPWSRTSGAFSVIDCAKARTSSSGHCSSASRNLSTDQSTQPVKPVGSQSGFGYAAWEYSLINPARIGRRWTLVVVEELTCWRGSGGRWSSARCGRW